jgi:hypothetical protein
MMKLKLQFAEWIVRRNEKRSRSARRALRDHQRQEWRRIRHDERRTCGLRLYIAWRQGLSAVRRFRDKVGPAAAPEHLVRVAPPSIMVPQSAH